jgi:hypothetical protein
MEYVSTTAPWPIPLGWRYVYEDMPSIERTVGPWSLIVAQDEGQWVWWLCPINDSSSVARGDGQDLLGAMWQVFDALAKQLPQCNKCGFRIHGCPNCDEDLKGPPTGANSGPEPGASVIRIERHARVTASGAPQLGLCPASGAPCSAGLLLQSAVMLHERAGVRVAAMALSSALDCNDHEAIQEHAATLRSAMGWDPAIGGGWLG